MQKVLILFTLALVGCGGGGETAGQGSEQVEPQVSCRDIEGIGEWAGIFHDEFLTISPDCKIESTLCGYDATFSAQSATLVDVTVDSLVYEDSMCLPVGEFTCEILELIGGELSVDCGGVTVFYEPLNT